MAQHLDSMTARVLTCLVLALAGLLSACHPEEVSGGRNASLAPCHLKGIDTELRCGTIRVLENRDDHTPTARHIAIWFAVLPSIARAPSSDPVVVIAGGPGQSASSVAGIVMPLFKKLNRTRDIVFIDQRGTGHSAPLTCAPPKGITDLASQLDPQLMLATLPQCAAEFAKKRVDVTHYLTDDAVADLDEVRRALGYGPLNLWAASYGTRVALEYLREYPKEVRSAVLDGVAPSNLRLPLDLAVDADQALSDMISACSADAACAKRYPGLGRQVDQLFESLSHGSFNARIVDPVTGSVSHVPLGGDTFSAWLRQPLYNALTASLVPQAVASAASGDFGTLAALNLSVSGDVFDQLSLGMHLSVVCSEDMAHVSEADIAAVMHTRFKDSFYRFYQTMCDSWRERFVPDSFFQPLVSDRPILMLEGGRDPATPPRHAMSLLPTLSKARLIISPYLGHGISSTGCAPDLIEQFIRNADATALKAQCLESMPAAPFFMPPVAKTE
jgi:pimeloyl-ACP methyl ester carboxylesterase